MSLPMVRGDREYEKFCETPSGKTAVRVCTETGEPIEVTGDLMVAGANTSGVMTVIALDAVTWVALPSTALASRLSFAVQNQSDNGNTILVNYTGTGSDGWRIDDGGYKELPVGPAITAYAKMLSGTGSILVDEVS